MSRLSPLTIIAVACLAAGGISAHPVAAQNAYHGHYNQGHGHQWRAPSWWSQRDRPGDYRCDAYWDANRSDCHESWRGQRVAYAYNRGHSSGYGYGHRGYAGRYDYGRYVSTVQGAGVWPGAYGRPDLVYPGSGQGYAPGRDPRRMDWCRRNYRSYDPGSGYYRAYSGRLVYCG